MPTPIQFLKVKINPKLFLNKDKVKVKLREVIRLIKLLLLKQIFELFSHIY